MVGITEWHKDSVSMWYVVFLSILYASQREFGTSHGFGVRKDSDVITGCFGVDRNVSKVLRSGNVSYVPREHTLYEPKNAPNKCSCDGCLVNGDVV